MATGSDSSQKTEQSAGAPRKQAGSPKTIKDELPDNFLAGTPPPAILFPGIWATTAPSSPKSASPSSPGTTCSSSARKAREKPPDAGPSPQVPRRRDPATSPTPRSPSTTTPTSRSPASAASCVGQRPSKNEVPIAWWPRSERYVERPRPGTKFADIIGEIDPAKLAGGTSMSAECALHFGLIPRMHRGIFAMNEVPELDELVQVGMFNILEERDVQIRGYPVRFDIDVLILFSANPADLQPQRQGDPAAQGPHRLGDPHPLSARSADPRHRASWSRKAALDLGGRFPDRRCRGS